MQKQRHPNFIIGGTAAGGTSFLSAILIQHPQIFLPKEMRPEPHYYFKSWEYLKGLDYYLSRWFQEVPDNAVAVGERSSSYLYGGKAVAKKIASDYPDMKFIFTLRNPIERTWANYRYTVLQGLENLSFEEALEAEYDRKLNSTGIWAEIQPHDYTGRGYYANQIMQFLEYFDQEKILLLKSELLSSQTDLELNKIYRFLGLTEIDQPYTRAPDHTSVNVINPRLQMELREYFKDRFDKVIEAIRKKEPIVNFILTEHDKVMLYKLLNNLTARKIPMPDSSRFYLRNLFSHDIANLQEYVDFDVSDWA